LQLNGLAQMPPLASAVDAGAATDPPPGAAAGYLRYFTPHPESVFGIFTPQIQRQMQ
jgi:hypothetical protein